MGLQAEQAQGVGRLEAEQTPADDHAGPDPRLLGVGPDGGEVVEGPVDERAGAVGARHRWHERRRASGEHEVVVALHPAGAGRHGAVRSVHGDDLLVDHDLDPVVGSEPGGHHRQLLGRHAVEHGREPDPVVGHHGLLAEHRDRPALVGTEGDQLLEEPVADHAVADDHQVGACGSGVVGGGLDHSTHRDDGLLPTGCPAVTPVRRAPRTERVPMSATSQGGERVREGLVTQNCVGRSGQC